MRRFASLILTVGLFFAGLIVTGLCLPRAFSSVASAETIEFPESELPTETVLPVFDKTVVVRDRRVKQPANSKWVREPAST